VSAESRRHFQDALISQAADLALHGNTALPLAHQTFMSDASDFFESAAFGNYRKEREGAQKLAIANLLRIDGVVKAIGSLGKLIAKRGGF
jgi:hypothetical protein